MGIHLSLVRGEEEGSTRLLHNRLLLCSMLWLAGSWQKVVGTSGGCLQTAGEAAKKIQTESDRTKCSHLGFSVSFPFSFSSAPLREGAEDARGDSGPGQGEIM